MAEGQSSLSNPISLIQPSTYNYQPLKLGQIRLVTLWPGKFSTSPVISLHISELNTSSPPSYEAISYAWGSTDYPAPITVSETGSSLTSASHSKAVIFVTRNLSEALRYLRHDKNPRVLWTDALCINQADVEERGAQVARMGDIFENAKRVIAWLGPSKNYSEDDDRTGTGRALRMMELLSKKIKVDWAAETMISAVPDRRWGDYECQLPWDQNVLNGVGQLLASPWFGRLWIWQEILLGSDSSVLTCGFDSILWTDFRKAIACMFHKRYSYVYGLHEVYRLVRTESNSSNLTLLLEDTRQCSCTDPRDRIFALLGLLDESNRLSIAPDYKKSAQEIFQDTVIKWIEQKKNLDIFLGYNFPSSDREHNIDQVTWTPDWSIGIRKPEISTTGACAAFSQSCAKLVDRNVLRVTGVKIGTIEKVESPTVNSWEDINDAIRKVTPEIVNYGEYAGGGTLLDAWCKTLVCDFFSETCLPSDETIPSFERCREILVDILLSRTIDKTNASATYYYDMAKGVLEGLSIITANGGYIGLGPRKARVGDFLAVFLGLSTVMLLRPTASAQSYRPIGDCYLHGIMKGEALLGPLPKNVRLVRHYDEGSTFFSFLNSKTGKVLRDDPRLGAVPQDWKMTDTPWNNPKKQFVNRETGEVTYQDPRLSPGHLMKLGAALETFDLI